MGKEFEQNCRSPRLQWLIEIAAKMILICLIGFLSLNRAGAGPLPQPAGPRYQVEINTKAHADYWHGGRSQLDPLVLAYVAVKDLQSDAANPARCEVLIYGDHHCLGCKRLCRLPAVSGGEAVIRYRGGTPDHSQEQSYAAAGAIVRVIVDCFLNDNTVGHVTVPEESFNEVTRELGRYGFVPRPAAANQFIPRKATITVDSEPPGITRKLYL